MQGKGKLNIFIYRPDLGAARHINPDLCFTPQGQSYHDWQRDREELYQYKLEQAKLKIERQKCKHKHYIEVSW